MAMKQKERKYPEYFVNEDRFDIKLFTDNAYNTDYRSAVRYAKKNGGEVYTVIDHPNGWAFSKGFHYVNRLGYAVVKYAKK